LQANYLYKKASTLYFILVVIFNICLVIFG
jgi:hypothetical protein